jgi:hypothetical protein
MLNRKLTGMALALFLISHSSSANLPATVKRGQTFIHRQRCQNNASDTVRIEPFVLNMKVVAPFSKGRGWKFTMDDSGSAHLTISTYPNPKTRSIKVSGKQIAQFRDALVKQQFFALGAEYGDKVPDGNTRILSIKQGKQNKSVTLRFLRSNASNLLEVKRAVRIWNIAQDWFNDADAIDMRSYDKRILDAK